jgi:hypothetical protein
MRTIVATTPRERQVAAPELPIDLPTRLEQLRSAYGESAPVLSPLRQWRRDSAAGLVICAISRKIPDPVLTPDEFLADFASKNLNFPSGAMVDATAALFPAVPSHSSERKRYNTRVSEPRTYLDNTEGSWTRVEIGPGIVRVRSRDENRSYKAKARADDERRRLQAEEVSNLLKPMYLAEFTDPRGVRAPIAAWSAKSRSRMISTVAELDLSPIVGGDNLPCMVTLTLPGDWLAVAPTAAVAARKFDNWRRAYELHWGVKLVCIWKREFQRRGAPHWHLWMVPPVPMHRMKEFRAWLSESWTKALQIDDAGERRRSLAAGTGVDFAEGMRARDPKRLGIYFLKESLGGEGKAYQNAAPAAWEGQSVGRFWGYRQIEKAVSSAPLDAVVSLSVVRTMRRWQRAQNVTKQTVHYPVTGPSLYPERNDSAAQPARVVGTVKPARKLRRPQRVIAGSGFVLVNDGPAFGEQLARWASVKSRQVLFEREMFADRRELVPADPPWLCTLPLDHPARGSL